MSVEKVYKCDLCGRPQARAEGALGIPLMRLGVRRLDERPEDADNVDVCTECRSMPVGNVLAAAVAMRGTVPDAD